MTVVGLCSTYAEGRLGEDAVRSLARACEAVYVLEGPIGDRAGPDHDWRATIRSNGKILLRNGEWGSDAEKRTELLEFAKGMHLRRARDRSPLWGVILDGDELLVNAESLPAYFDAVPADALGFSLHLMELDGSCSYIPNRVLRLDRIERWIISSYAFQVDGVAVSMPNVPILNAGEPDSNEVVAIGESGERQRRRPLQGEPHILHRAVLRPPERRARPRQHEAEAETFEALAVGQPIADGVAEGGVRLWLPS